MPAYCAGAASDRAPAGRLPPHAQLVAQLALGRRRRGRIGQAAPAGSRRAFSGSGRRRSGGRRMAWRSWPHGRPVPRPGQLVVVEVVGQHGSAISRARARLSVQASVDQFGAVRLPRRSRSRTAQLRRGAHRPPARAGLAAADRWSGPQRLGGRSSRARWPANRGSPPDPSTPWRSACSGARARSPRLQRSAHETGRRWPGPTAWPWPAKSPRPCWPTTSTRRVAQSGDRAPCGQLLHAIPAPAGAPATAPREARRLPARRGLADRGPAGAPRAAGLRAARVAAADRLRHDPLADLPPVRRHLLAGSGG